MSFKMTVQELAAVVGGEVISEPHSQVQGVATDTRKDLSGQLFVALKGHQFDAHDFLASAAKSKASAMLVHKDPRATLNPGDRDLVLHSCSVVLVSDTLKALQKLANAWRKQLAATVIAISGSNGKTTTKEYSGAILGHKFKTYFSPGSYNNHWGVPLSLLSISKAHEMAVLEMGMNHQGELKELVQIAEPNICLVTNVGRAHVGELGGLQQVADAKEELYLYAPKGSRHIYNLANPFTRKMYEKNHGAEDLTFGVPEARVYLNLKQASLSDLTVEGHINGEPGKASVPVFGRHNVENLMAAAAVALACGMEPVEIWTALCLCRNSWGRNQIVPLKSGATALFDAYNANPESMIALMDNIAQTSVSGQKVIVLGEMLELGSDSAKLHRELGQKVAQTGADIVWFMGEHKDDFAAGLEDGGFKNNSMISAVYEEALAIKIGSVLKEHDIAVLKGSRGMKLEQVLKVWEPINF